MSVQSARFDVGQKANSMPVTALLPYFYFQCRPM